MKGDREEGDNDLKNRIKNLPVLELNPEELSAHPINISIYGDEEVDLSLVESIRQFGLYDLIIIKVIKTDSGIVYMIISGHRRWRALLYINKNGLGKIITDENENVVEEQEFVPMKVKCLVIAFENERVETKTVIELNKRRSKRWIQTYNEIEALHTVFDPAARVKCLNNLKNVAYNSPAARVRRLKGAVKNGDIDGQIIDWTLTKEEIAFQYGYLIDGEVGDDRYSLQYEQEDHNVTEKISQILGMTTTQIKTLRRIGRFAYDYGDEIALNVMKYLDLEKITLNAADKIVRLRNIYLERMPGAMYAKKLVNQVDADIQKKISGKRRKKGDPQLLTPEAAWKKIQQKFPSNYMKSNKPRKKSYFNSPVYAVILVDPKDLKPDKIPEFLSLYIPAARDSALYIIADRKNIRYCINLFEIHAFTLQSFIPIHLGTGYGMLLAGVKGQWAIPDSEYQISEDAIWNCEDVPEHISGLYPEVDSFLKVPAGEWQPKGWGKILEPKPESVLPEEIEDDKNEIIHEKNDDRGGGKRDKKDFRRPASEGRW